MTPTAHPITYGHDPSLAQFSVARYQRMIEVGIIKPEDKVELLEHYVVCKIARNPLHDGTIQIVYEVIRPSLPPGWLVRVGQTIVLADSQPEPDFAIVRGNARSYLTRHPTPADVALLIEVADSSLLRDQRDKTRIYARGSIPCYWIVNLGDRRVEVYTQPSGPTTVPVYGAFQLFQPGDAVPLVLAGAPAATVAAADLLP
jgi:Uma2 family endonuclease